jgi:Outer membrane protein beta-barrel family/CarboxypepD_reg-like domain
MKHNFMMRVVLVLLVFMFWAGMASGQGITLKGKLTDKDDSKPVPGATVKIMAGKDSAGSKTVLTDTKGRFEFTGLSAGMYELAISSAGYEKIQQKINLQASNKEAISFSINKLSKLLGEVTVTSKTAPVKQKGDTTEFSASQFKVNPDATAEDMIKKLPGITIDRSGNVTAQGEQVRKVTVDGRDFFGDDATAALRNLPAEVIDKIQVFDRLSDQATFTGFDDGNSSKSINIVTKANMRSGQFGRVFAGAGTDGRYSSGGNVSLFKNNRRLSIIGLSNNINQQNFATQDLLGVTSGSTSGNRGGGRGGSRGGGGGSNNGGNFLVGQQNGISTTNSFGLNFSDQWGKKAEFSGSYFFNNSNNKNDQLSGATYFLNSGKNQLYDENTVSGSSNYNHRLNLRLEYKIDSANSISIAPTLSFQKNNSSTSINGLNSFSPTELISQSVNSTNNLSKGYNFSNNILFRHAFKKRGRTISLNLNTAINKRDGETYIDNSNRYYRAGVNTSDSLQQFTDQFSNGYSLSASIAYTEAVGKNGQLQLNYTPSYTKSKADQEAYRYDYVADKYSIFDNNLSNEFDNTVVRHNTGVSYRKGNRDNMFSIGLAYQYTSLSSTQVFPFAANVQKSFNNVLPSLMWIKKINAKNSIRIFYRSSTNAPAVTQLQDVINNANPLFISTGNPDLKQQFSNVLSTRYTFTNTAKGKSFFANLFVQQNSNYIGNATYIASRDSILNSSVTLFRGSQLSKPANFDGYWSLRSFFTYSMPVKLIKSNISLNAGVSYVKTPGLINNILNQSNAYVYNGGLVIASNISEYIDFNLSYSANFNVVKNSIQPQLNNNFVNQSAGAQINLLSKKGWFVQNDVTNQKYSGLTDGFNQNYWLWNAAVGKKFLKNKQGELRLSVFDLLKQNQSIVRTVTDTYIEDVQNQVLQQYFMLTFSYKLKNFGTPARAAVRGEGREGRERGGFGGF